MDTDEGFLFRLGTDGLPAGSKLQVTKVTLGQFQTAQIEHIVILNNTTGDYMTVDPDVVLARKEIDVSSLNIILDAGQAQVDPNNVSAGNFTVMCGEPEVTTGWRLESVTLNVIPEPASIGLVVIGAMLVAGIRHVSKH
ncbi:MAG: hypothetical protein AB7E95_09600 [Kiritimatiellales bacterium]